MALQLGGKILYSLRELAAAAGVSKRTIRSLLETEGVRLRRLGRAPRGKLVVLREDLKLAFNELYREMRQVDDEDDDEGPTRRQPWRRRG